MNDFDSASYEPLPPTDAPALAPESWDVTASTEAPAEIFHSYVQPAPPARIPHLGHLALLGAFAAVGLLCSTLLMMAALQFHLFGMKTIAEAATDVHYILGIEAIIYLVTFLLAILLFPLFWHTSFFAGIQWRGTVALKLFLPLTATALGCLVLAVLVEWLLPGPANAPIEDIFRSPGAAWLMFGFGVAVAPFCEEIAFRGFLLPSLATAWDWAIEQSTGKAARPLDENGHPQWSIFAMVVASIATSLPFALMHAEQQGHAVGPFVLLVAISLILCAVRLKTRSLAASTLVHASYNFMIFSLMLIGTGGFRHMDKM